MNNNDIMREFRKYDNAKDMWSALKEKDGHTLVAKLRILTIINKANVVNKIPPVLIHRSITRKLAAQIANKQQKSAVEITKPPILVAPITEHYKATGYSDVPMFVQHTKAIMEEIDRMVHYKFELIKETLYLTMNLFDRFLAVQLVIRKKLQLVGIIALLLTYKYEEVSVTVVEDLILISDKAYARKEVLKMVELVSFFFIKLCLVEYEMLRFLLSMLATATVFTAQVTLGVSREWNASCEKNSNYGKNQIL
ncbi:Cyclin-B2-3 [Capsicum annuum]|nr:Cyclin-B2-3 [Capsicum annuum]KAF3678237.1 Cyclin-B2-3 [Capsicum annuum]